MQLDLTIHFKFGNKFAVNEKIHPAVSDIWFVGAVTYLIQAILLNIAICAMKAISLPLSK